MSRLLHRLDIRALTRALGIKGETVQSELADEVQLVYDISDFLLPDAGAEPAPIAPAGLEPPQQVGTGVFNRPVGATNTVLELWGAALVAGTDPVNKFSRLDTPPNRDYEIWGVNYNLTIARGAIGAMDGILQFTDGTTREEQLISFWGTVVDAANGLYESSRAIWFPRPFIIAANQNPRARWIIDNRGAAAADFDLTTQVWWKYH